jgi:hypothetical protein
MDIARPHCLLTVWSRAMAKPARTYDAKRMQVLWRDAFCFIGEQILIFLGSPYLFQEGFAERQSKIPHAKTLLTTPSSQREVG